MKPLIEGENSSGLKIQIDLNDVVLNPAGSNMTIATYPDKELDRGNRKPIYENYKSVRLTPADKKTVDDLFNLKVAEQASLKKIKQTQISRCKKNTQRQIA